MGMTLKLLMIMITMRLEKVLSDKGLLAKEQAGFRTSEECVGQAAALIEALQRRRKANLMSLLLFVDLSKAYDTVPHGALMYKLQQIGVRGRMYEFIKVLYDVSEVQVRLPTGVDSPAFKLERGLRQGCPASPILFDIFINDMFTEVHGEPKIDYGVEVPGVSVEQYGRLAGLLFADDMVGIAKDRWQLQRIANRVTEWCRRWGMKVGIQKCGVMVIGAPGSESRADVIQEKLEDEWPIRISSQNVPAVSEYKYLGLLIRRDLDIDVMAKGRLEKAEKTYRTIYPYLRCASIPLAARVAVFKAVVVTTALYGSEVWGMNIARCSDIQMLLNKALRIMMGSSENDKTIPVAAMWRECNVPPVHATASANKARALMKYGHLKTWIGILCNSPAPRKGCKDPTWLEGAVSWMKKEKFEALLKDMGTEDDVSGMRAQGVVFRAIWGKMERAKGNKASWAYVEAGYRSPALAFAQAVPEVARRDAEG